EALICASSCNKFAALFSETMDIFSMCFDRATNRLRQQTGYVRYVIVASYPVSYNNLFAMIVLRQQGGHFFCDCFRFDVRQNVYRLELYFFFLIIRFFST